ncbi:NB-ARC domain-containing protein [Streptomyces sp. NPDC005706]|uniref:NB-ARC domain-containing protein n=1 Tax=Streptomyces sp. NPDC005706 TaxID=3157169 RepID=UPI0033EBBF9F
MSLEVAVPVIVGVLGFLYLVFFGQRSVVEWYVERRRRRDDRSEREEASERQIENLPSPDYAELFGRDREMDRIISILRPYPHSQHAVVALDGIGGSGKSALALEVARYYVVNHLKLDRGERFDAVIWVSAKENLLTARGTQIRPWRHRTLDDIFETIAICLGREDITRAPADHRVEVVRNALKRQRTLLIVDNMETINDVSVESFLRELPAPTKAIVTTRYRLDVAVSVSLGNLPAGESRSLLRQLVSQTTDSGTGTGTDAGASVDSLIGLTGGLPLAIVWSAARIRLGMTLDEVVEDLSSGHDDLTRYSFSGILERVSVRPGRVEVMHAIAALPTPVTLGLAAGAAGIADQESVRAALHDLVHLSLLQRQAGTWDMHPLVRRHLRPSDAGDHDAILERATRYQVGYLSRLIGDERTQHVRATQYASIDLEWPNIRYLIARSSQEGAHEDVRSLVGGLGYYLHARGLWTDAVWAWETGATSAEECGDVVAQARFLTYLGYMAFFMGRPARATYYRRQAERLVAADRPSYQLGSLLRLSGYLARESGHTDEALGHFRRGLEVMRTCDNVHGICRLLNDLAETQALSSQAQEAETLAQEALSRADAEGEVIEKVRSMGVLANIALSAGNLGLAHAYATESRDQALECGWWEDAGKAFHILARTEAAAGNHSRARSLAVEAETYFDRIGSERGIAECRAFLTGLPDRGRRRILGNRV